MGQACQTNMEDINHSFYQDVLESTVKESSFALVLFILLIDDYDENDSPKFINSRLPQKWLHFELTFS